MEYNFNDIEARWQKYWKEQKTYKVSTDQNKPKYYVLDMFPYPSGAGLHVGHPLGYIASDIYSRYMALKGYNVLHPMGYDAYGLPAEQYAIQTGQHPAITTEKNIARYREQLDKIGFSFDWSREVRTCEPEYYKWTQWVFLKMFGHWYNNTSQKAEPIEGLVKRFEADGNTTVDAACSETTIFSAKDWNAMDHKHRQEVLLNYRLAYLADTMVNWCPTLGTVLANDEVREGLSVRGGHVVEQKVMRQWLLRITAYAERLLTGLDDLNWSDSLKEMQRNWIGRSEGVEIWFDIKGNEERMLIFTTRPDTIFGCTFMVLAPESELVAKLTTKEQNAVVQAYVAKSMKRTERERIAEVKKVSGEFTGAYAINPLTKKEIPIWVSDYVLAGYGTGAIMAVPAHDGRDYAFASQFGLPIIPVIVPYSGEIPQREFYDAKEGIMINSDFINGLDVRDGILKTLEYIEKNNMGSRQINYRLRDAIFSRQRYWGEPFPIYFKDGIPCPMAIEQLPLELPSVDKYAPTEDGQPPLGRAKNWFTKEGYPIELSTMPGFAGSSAYYLRYMDPRNANELVSKEANAYWQDVDLYIGGTEHATGHLVYARYWNKFLFDLGLVCKEEPFKKLINQGMIQGRSNFVYRIHGTNKFVSANLINLHEVVSIHVDVNIVENDILDIEAFKNWSPEYKTAEFILSDDGKYHCGWAVEKMSKSLHNVVNPDNIVQKFGADTLRMYEMFLGPLELSKPWDTNGIDGVHKFLKRFWRIYHNEQNEFEISDAVPTTEELKALYKTIKKIEWDIEHFSFNTSVSAFMICINELIALKCNKKAILEPLLVILCPFAPHICEELWQMIGNNQSITKAIFPKWDESLLVESTFEYPVSINGKMRFKKELDSSFSKEEVGKEVMKDERLGKYIEGKPIRKVIVVQGKIVNIVI